MLAKTLKSLFNVRGILSEQVHVFHDGGDAQVREMVQELAPFVRYVPHQSEGNNGAERISAHYKFALSTIFAMYSSSEFVLVVEDDMIFSSDLLEFFVQLAPMYRTDPSLHCISSFNDNGFKGLVRDPGRLHRTDFFIGLGWIVYRNLFNEWLPKWPLAHWDHFLRDPHVRQGRHCVYPEISRNYNIGEVGTHSDSRLYNKYFKDIQLWSGESAKLDIGSLAISEYDTWLGDIIDSALPLGVKEIHDIQEGAMKNATLILALSFWNPEYWENLFANFFGLWHQPERTLYKEIHLFWFKSNHIVIGPVTSELLRSRQSKLRPVTRIEALDFLFSGSIVKAKAHSQDCFQVCSASGLFCEHSDQSLINNCESLYSHFNCSSCIANNGVDQPAFVIEDQRCLVNSMVPGCGGSHPLTLRLCACASKSARI
jgi:hypothetical protein